MAAPSTTRFLNREGRWRGFRWSGLELEGADLRLRSVPRGDAVLAADLPDPAEPAGIAELPSGDVVFSDPDAGRLWLMDACDGRVRPLVRAELRRPRGLLYHPPLRALLVADAALARIAVLAVPSFELADLWDARGTLGAPASLAAGEGGAVYVTDLRDGALHRLDGRDGEPLPGFSTPQGTQAVEVAADGGRVFVLDRRRRVLVLGGDRPSGPPGSGGRAVCARRAAACTSATTRRGGSPSSRPVVSQSATRTATPDPWRRSRRAEGAC